jgi:hypothetical protein
VNRNIGALSALVFVLTGCGGGTLDAQSFKKEAEAIQSFAAEGALLADDVADGKSTVPFTRVHAGELTERAAKLAQTLASAEATPAVREELAEAVELAKLVTARLEELENAPGDAEAARRVRRELEAAARRAEELAAV